MRYAFIKKHSDQFPIRRMCQVLEVSSSGYYAWCRRQPSARASANVRLQLQIKRIYEASDRTYGSPRIYEELTEMGVS